MIVNIKIYLMVNCIDLVLELQNNMEEFNLVIINKN